MVVPNRGHGPLLFAWWSMGDYFGAVQQKHWGKVPAGQANETYQAHQAL